MLYAKITIRKTFYIQTKQCYIQTKKQHIQQQTCHTPSYIRPIFHIQDHLHGDSDGGDDDDEDSGDDDRRWRLRWRR